MVKGSALGSHAKRTSPALTCTAEKYLGFAGAEAAPAGVSDV